MWYSLVLVDRRASLLGFFIGHNRGARCSTWSLMALNLDAVRLMSTADFYDAWDEILLGSDGADIVIQRLTV
jgi:hypothetical protein